MCSFCKNKKKKAKMEKKNTEKYFLWFIFYFKMLTKKICYEIVIIDYYVVFELRLVGMSIQSTVQSFKFPK